jgi:hypothetical protein
MIAAITGRTAAPTGAGTGRVIAEQPMSIRAATESATRAFTGYRPLAGAPAGWGARWVRVGPNALLIRINNGRILRAVRKIYW